MITSWISFFCFLLAAIVHIGFFYYEFFKIKNTGEARIWAKNMGVYNLCIAIGTLIGLYMIFKKQVMIAGYVTGLFGATMIVAAITLWFTAPHLRKLALLQGLPPLIGFLFLSLHVMERLGLW